MQKQTPQPLHPLTGPQGPLAPPGPPTPSAVGTTQLTALYNRVPFVTAPFIPKTRNTRNGRGMLVAPVTGPANTDIAVTHNLGRLVQGMLCISNGLQNQLFTAKLRMSYWPPDARNTPKVLTIQADIALDHAVIWFI